MNKGAHRPILFDSTSDLAGVASFRGICMLVGTGGSALVVFLSTPAVLMAATGGVMAAGLTGYAGRLKRVRPLRL